MKNAAPMDSFGAAFPVRLCSEAFLVDTIACEVSQNVSLNVKGCAGALDLLARPIVRMSSQPMDHLTLANKQQRRDLILIELDK
jgi:hypothetical protein